MVNLLTQFSDSSSGLGALGLNGQAFVIQLVAFLIVFLVLRKWAFKPILRVLKERRDIIENGVKLGEEMQKERARLEAQVAKALHEARQQADEILAGAQDEARSSIREAEEKARQKAESVLADAKDRIDQDMARARQKLEKEVVGLVSDATEAIIGEKVDAKKDSALIDKALKEQRA